MKRFILFSILIAFFASSCTKKEVFDTQKNITLENPGELRELLSEDEKSHLTELIISGPLNGTDIITIRAMASYEALAILDMSGASIVDDRSDIISIRKATFFIRSMTKSPHICSKAAKCCKESFYLET